MKEKPDVVCTHMALAAPTDAWTRSLNTLMNGLPTYAFFKAVDGTYIQANTMFCSLVDLSEYEIVGKSDYDIFSSGLASKLQAAHCAVVKNGVPAYHHSLDLFGVNNTVNVSIGQIPIRDEVGSVVGVFGIAFKSKEHRNIRDELICLNNQFLVLDKLVSGLSVSHDVPDIINATRTLFKRQLEIPVGRVFLYDHLTDELTLQTCWGFEDQSASECLLGIDLHRDEIWRKHIDTTSECVGAVIAHAVEGCDSTRYICIPLVVDGSLTGAIDFVRDSTLDLDEVDTAFYAILGQHIGMAIDYARLHEQLSASKEQMHQLSMQLLHAQECERRSIAREIHDEIGSSFAALYLSLELLTGKVSDGDACLSHAKNIVIEMADRVHDMSLDLRPRLLESRGLVLALESYFTRYTQRTGIHVSFEQWEADRHLDPEIEICVFRATQEALTNVVKHSHAESVTVRLSADEHTLVLMIRDNGCGFERETAMTDRESSGLYGLHDRVLSVGGEISVVSCPGVGTRIYIHLPIK